MDTYSFKSAIVSGCMWCSHFQAKITEFIFIVRTIDKNTSFAETFVHDSSHVLRWRKGLMKNGALQYEPL